MRYAKIDKCEYVNGEGVGCTLYVSGCHFQCKGCFNHKAWDFDYGYDWNENAMNKFIDCIDKQYIKRISILGGEPFAKENIEEVIDIIKELKTKFPDKKVWVFTGYTWRELYFNLNYDNMLSVLLYIDIIVDGRYVEELKDPTLKFAGSSNQQLINVQETLKQNKIVLYNN